MWLFSYVHYCFTCRDVNFWNLVSTPQSWSTWITMWNSPRNMSLKFLKSSLFQCWLQPELNWTLHQPNTLHLWKQVIVLKVMNLTVFFCQDKCLFLRFSWVDPENISLLSTIDELCLSCHYPSSKYQLKPVLSTCHWFIGFLKGTQAQEMCFKRQNNLVCLSGRSWICAPFPFLPSTSNPAVFCVQIVLLIPHLFSCLLSSVTQREISANDVFSLSLLKEKLYISLQCDLASPGHSVVSNYSSILDFILKLTVFFFFLDFNFDPSFASWFLKMLYLNL